MECWARLLAGWGLLAKIQASQQLVPGGLAQQPKSKKEKQVNLTTYHCNLQRRCVVICSFLDFGVLGTTKKHRTWTVLRTNEPGQRQVLQETRFAAACFFWAMLGWMVRAKRAGPSGPSGSRGPRGDQGALRAPWGPRGLSGPLGAGQPKIKPVHSSL
jgi:hypothetical protein